MSAQELQDKYGYVVMGWWGRQLAIGDTLPGFRNDWGKSEAVEAPLVVVGFTDINEWKQQASDDPRCDWVLAETYNQIIKVRAE